MTLRRHIAHLLTWWKRQHPSKALEACIPSYAAAARSERRARARNDCRAIGRAVAAKQAVLHQALAGKQ